MKANELRIDNYLHGGQVCVITERTVFFRDDKKYCYKYSADEVKPIPLTEKWLFKMPDWFRERIKDGFFNYYDGNDTKSIDIDYVHTAQNLYFALTGKELEFNGKDNPEKS